MIVGNDISNAQGQIDWATYHNNANFVLMKATEGTGYIDTWFGNNRQQARSFGLPRGFYHFARPDLGNTPEAEAAYFESLIDGDSIQEGEVLALDYEVQYNDPVGWCKDFLDAVSEHYGGLKPLIYLNQSTAVGYDWTPVIDAGYALWIAAYTYDPNNNNFNGGKWQTCAIQQWTDTETVPGISSNVDGDIFFGDSGAFGQYGYQKPLPPKVLPPATIMVPVSISVEQGTAVSNPTPPSVNSTTPPVVILTPVQNNIPVNQPKPVTPNFLSAFIQWLKSLFEGR